MGFIEFIFYIIIVVLILVFFAAILHAIKDVSELKKEMKHVKAQNEELKELLNKTITMLESKG